MRRLARLAHFCALLACALAGGACSQGKADAASKQCERPLSCGGDIVGSWQVTAACFGSSFLVGMCQKSVDASNVSETGSITYNADGTYVASLVYSGSYLESYPASCIPDGSTCSDLGVSLGYSTPCSMASDGSCACTTQAGVASDRGSYSVNDTTLQLSSTLGRESTEFCVQGARLGELVQNQAGELLEVRTLTRQ